MSQLKGQWWATLRAHLAADQRKTIALAVLSVIMVIVWARLIFKSDTSIAAASQMEIVPELVAMNREAPTAAPNSSTMQVVDASPEKPRVPLTPVDVSSVSREFARDLFAADWETFPRAVATQPSEGDASRPRSFVGRIREAARAESARQRRRAESVRREAAGLVVQSTVIGHEPSAMVSGKLVHVGDRLGDLDVVEIRAGQVVVRKDGVRVILSMP